MNQHAVPKRPSEDAVVTGPRLLRFGVAVLLGLLVYGGFYAYLEHLVYEYGYRNRFYQIATAEEDVPYVVILGASRALPLEFGGMHAELEHIIGGPSINLALPGGGVMPNYVLLDYFFSRHQARAVIYFLDSFAFYSSEWNEERLEDSRLWQRAPFDSDLVRSLWWATRRYAIDWSVFRNYLSAFSKINDPTTWFTADVWEGEAQFDHSHQPSEWMDTSRLEYLYSKDLEQATLERYLTIFSELIEDLKAREVLLIVVKAPLREDFYQRLPGEEAFDSQLIQLLQRYEVPFYDFSSAGFEAWHFYDLDHLNNEGVRRFLEDLLQPMVARYLRGSGE